ncbi:response regulator [Pelobium sp.]|nr:response regulator [Pelobium sp.]MDA9555474.1 response regulator [Pelobium sp.]
MTNKYTAIIVDDEESARQHLTTLLADYPQIMLIADANNGKDGLKLIDQHQPDLIFLDLDMPLMNGFELFSKLKKQPKVFFMTDADESAIKIFEEKKLDYLLKPITKESLNECIEKLETTHQALAQPLKNLLDKLKF